MINEQLKMLVESGIILSPANKETLDNLITEIDVLYKTEISSDKDEREAQYAKYRDLITTYGKTLGDIKFNLLLSKEEYLFLKDQMLKKSVYSRENLIIAQLVRDEFFYTVDTEKITNKTSLFKNGTHVEAFGLNITDLTKLSHLTNFIELPCVHVNSDYFITIIKRIGDINKIFDLYKQTGDKLSEQGGNWIQGFEKWDTAEEIEPEKIN